MDEYTDIAVVRYGQAFYGAIRPLVVGNGTRGFFGGGRWKGPGIPHFIIILAKDLTNLSIRRG